mgnify:CR=1 FL=1
MRALTVRHSKEHCGVWNIMHGRTRLAIIVMPNVQAHFGITPSKQSVIDAMQEHAPAYGATMQTPVLIEAL